MHSDGLVGIAALSGLPLLSSARRPRAESRPLSAAQYARQLATSRDWQVLYARYKANAPLCPAGTIRTGRSPNLVALFTRQWRDWRSARRARADGPDRPGSGDVTVCNPCMQSSGDKCGITAFGDLPR